MKFMTEGSSTSSACPPVRAASEAKTQTDEE